MDFSYNREFVEKMKKYFALNTNKILHSNDEILTRIFNSSKISRNEFSKNDKNSRKKNKPTSWKNISKNIILYYIVFMYQISHYFFIILFL